MTTATDRPYRVVVDTLFGQHAEKYFDTEPEAKAFFERVKREGAVFGRFTALPRALKCVSLEGPEGVMITPGPAVVTPKGQTQ